jgi:hypothetical protein
VKSFSRKKQNGRTWVRPLGEIEIPRNPKLTAQPQYEARAHVIYFDFFLAFFFFVAMTVFLDVSDEPTAGLVQVAGFVSVPGPSPPYRNKPCHSAIQIAIKKRK